MTMTLEMPVAFSTRELRKQLLTLITDFFQMTQKPYNLSESHYLAAIDLGRAHQLIFVNAREVRPGRPMEKQTALRRSDQFVVELETFCAANPATFPRPDSLDERQATLVVARCGCRTRGTNIKRCAAHAEHCPRCNVVLIAADLDAERCQHCGLKLARNPATGEITAHARQSYAESVRTQECWSFGTPIRIAKIDPNKYGSATLAACAIRDMLIGILAHDDALSRVLEQIGLMRDSGKIAARSTAADMKLDELVASDDFRAVVASELALIVDRLQHEQRYDVAAGR